MHALEIPTLAHYYGPWYYIQHFQSSVTHPRHLIFRMTFNVNCMQSFPESTFECRRNPDIGEV